MWKWGRASDDKLIERVCALITNALDLPRDFRLVEETRLHGSGLGVDSLDALRLVAELEDEFNITVDDTELTPSNFETVGSLVSLVRRLRE